MAEKQRRWPAAATGWIFRIVMALVLGIVLLCQGWDYAYKTDVVWKNWLCLIVGAAGAAALYMAARTVTAYEHRRAVRLAWIGGLSLVTAGLVFYLAAHYAFTPGWDAGFMCESASALAAEDVDPLAYAYLSEFPNNTLLTWSMSRMFLLSDALGLPHSQRYFLILGIQSAGFGLTAYLLYLCADKLAGKEHPAVPLWTWTMGLILVCASPWVAVQYSDVPALILAMIETALYLNARDGRHPALWTGLLAAAGLTAYHIKPQGAFPMIAFAVITVCENFPGMFRKERLRRTGAVALGFLIGAGLVQGGVTAVKNSFGENLNPDEAVGPAHYLMMGMNPEAMGVFSYDDLEFSEGFTNPRERTAGDLERLRERIQKMGAEGVLKQLVRKTMTNFADGTFTWEQEEVFFAYDTYFFPAGNDWVYENVLPFYISEKNDLMVEWSCSWIFRLIEQCAWMAVMALCLFSAGGKKDGRVAALQLTLLGLILFETLFEARARYVFCCLPVFILVSGVGIGRAEDGIRRAADAWRARRPVRTVHVLAEEKK